MEFDQKTKRNIVIRAEVDSVIEDSQALSYGLGVLQEYGNGFFEKEILNYRKLSSGEEYKNLKVLYQTLSREEIANFIYSFVVDNLREVLVKPYLNDIKKVNEVYDQLKFEAGEKNKIKKIAEKHRGVRFIQRIEPYEKLILGQVIPENQDLLSYNDLLKIANKLGFKKEQDEVTEVLKSVTINSLANIITDFLVDREILLEFIYKKN